jgi:hypothetical protein
VFDDAIDAELRRKAEQEARREEARLKFREHFPKVTAFADEARKYFGDGVEVSWAIENGKSVGRVPPTELEAYGKKHGPVQPLRLYEQGDPHNRGARQGKRSA